ncbi:hypothetical protein EXIGLDRAFT_762003 [Exidia glandulosa HHB12029]|uniref:Uncharacterized protein n=1 Tax=Exidia glandulosa HHB12029 TaxID=1314781 RepID=A0A165N342_EXIGL|nr:hypothetical protein EXIGLDRAFT_762003 [Exidia glandulosa HHB12029]
MDINEILAIATVMPSLDAILAREAEELAAFLETAEEHLLPLWDPKPENRGLATWDVDEISRLRRLNIPGNTAPSIPDLGIYALGHLDALDPAFPNTLNDFVNGENHTFLSDASGVGKTRLVTEALDRYGGFYFTCTAGTSLNAHGSADLATALTEIRTQGVYGSGLFENIAISKRMSRRATAELAHNQRHVRRIFDRLLLSRLLVFNEFCSQSSTRGLAEERARRIWLLLQLRPDATLHHDYFYTVYRTVEFLHDEEVAHRLGSALEACGSRISYVVIDEAHIAQDRFRHAFATSTYEAPRHASILRELIKCFADHLPQQRLVVSSPQLDLPLMIDAIADSNNTTKDVRHFGGLRTLDSVERCTDYLNHFFPNVFSPEDYRQVYTWTRGRMRFLALLTTYTLMFGARNMLQCLYALVSVLVDYNPRGVEPPLAKHDDFRLETVLPLLDYKDMDRSAAWPTLRKSVVDYALHGRTEPRLEHCASLVSLNAAHFLDSGSSPSAVVDEPIILLRLTRWVETSARASIFGVIRRKLEDNTFDLNEAAFVEGFAPVLWRALKTFNMSACFDFPGLRPDWVQHRASIVLPCFGRRRRPFVPLTARPESLLLHVVETSDDVFKWLNDASEPFLIPDKDFGAELLFMLDLHGDAQVLVTVHTKFSEVKRTRRDLRAVPPRPEEFYRKSPEDNQRLMDILAKLPPLPIGSRKRTRGSDATKVRHARLPLLRLLCFAGPWRSHEAYDPPVASVNFGRLLQLPPPVEFNMSDVEKRISE